MSVVVQNENTMPVLGVGTYSAKSDDSWVEIIKHAIDIGYRHIDCSAIYGNETMIREAIAEKISQGVVVREDLFVTSKLWNNKHEKELVVPTLKRTLANLGLQYVDLYLIHWPFSVPDIPGEFFPKDKNNNVLITDVDFKATWKGMEDCVEKGLAKFIGLCNFNLVQLKNLFRFAKTKPAVLQVECHPYLTQAELVEYCKSINVLVSACLPLGQRIPAMKGRSLMNDPVLKTIARKHKKTPSQIAIRYQLERGLAAIPLTTKKTQLEEYFNVSDFSLTPKDVLVLDCLDKEVRYLNMKEYRHHKYYPFGSTFEDEHPEMQH